MMKRSSKLIIGIVLALVIVASSTLIFAANDEIHKTQWKTQQRIQLAKIILL